MQEEKNIDIKGTLEKFIKANEPEMEQEEQIAKFDEKELIKAIKNSGSSSNDEDNSENIEEQEHAKRIKQELLASLERVKQLEKQIYGEESKDREKNKLKVEGKLEPQTQKNIQQDKQQPERKTKIQEVEQRERE